MVHVILYEKRTKLKLIPDVIFSLCAVCPGEAGRAGDRDDARLGRPRAGAAHRGALQRGDRPDRDILHTGHRHQEVRGHRKGRHQENWWEDLNIDINVNKIGNSICFQLSVFEPREPSPSKCLISTCSVTWPSSSTSSTWDTSRRSTSPASTRRRCRSSEWTKKKWSYLVRDPQLSSIVISFLVFCELLCQETQMESVSQLLKMPGYSYKIIDHCW